MPRPSLVALALLAVACTAPPAEEPSAIRFDCDTGTPLFVSYAQPTNAPSALLVYGNRRVTAYIAPSGSGARYAAEGVDFWEHQGEASVEWFGTRLTCRPRRN